MALAEVAHDYFRGTTALVVPGGVVVDAGANVGMYSVLVALAQPTAIVHAFEPIATSFNAAQANVTVNGVADRVKLNQRALGSEATSEQLSLTCRGRRGTLCADLLSKLSRTGATEVVSVVRLDDYCEIVGVERVDVLKLDLEGYEVNVLEGTSTLAHTRVVVMEWHSPDRAQRADRLLTQAGLVLVAPFSDAFHRTVGIGYWARQ
jgi:FkbM family methyltransferase